MTSSTLLFFSSKACPLCQRLSIDVGKVEAQGYVDGVPVKRNRLEVLQIDADNQTKWAPELLHYQVTKVPAFVLLDKQGRAVASTTGPKPYEQMQAVLSAFVSRALSK
ncbi:hypothetical protein HYH02_007538 [Chlamydomonas schloesseri]|uniref:Thioredoxin domain-containing protein n=1 Tax=Chlamydomonas schloesseri TaxID=2026947 RepID=A0A835WI13_9CHLO|nr:hypothetical protein HYH02_007538 [Chlamydomonas schloesseri]|eukprot:KAG2447619.1 hypothetical protein HYH02_007538 [Chlamydomonas schloesseri]